MASRRDHEDYLVWICKNFSPIFWPTKRRFAVITLGNLSSVPKLTADILPLNDPAECNAAYFGDPVPRETVTPLFEHLPDMIVKYLKQYGKLPKSIYLFSRYIPTPECSAVVNEFITSGFQKTIREFVNENRKYETLLGEVDSVVFRIGWTKDKREDNLDATRNILISNPKIDPYEKIAEDVKRQESLDEHGEYLVQLCKHFSQIFWQTEKQQKQFAVLTFGRLDSLPEITVDHRLLYYQSEHWIAAYYGDTQPRHAEEVLFEPLPDTIEEYLNENGELLECIYLYSRHIPRREFINIISEFIDHAKSVRRTALGEVSPLVFRIGWTQKKFEKENDILRTIKDFEEFWKRDGNANIKPYLKIAKDVKRD